MTYVIFGWENLFIDYQREYRHIVDVVTRRSREPRVTIVPELSRVLDPFRLCSFSDLRLVILGQDPYKTNATGLAFSTDDGTITPSLKVISSWLDAKNFDGNLTRWALQGVLLINCIPTMETNPQPISHRTIWESFIRGCLSTCSRKRYIVFLLLGSVAAEYEDSIDDENNLVIKLDHPSYLARIRNYDSKIDIFNNINKYLSNNYRGTIDFT